MLQSDGHKMANPLDWNSTPTFIKKHFPHWKDTAPTTTTTSQPNQTTGIICLLNNQINYIMGLVDIKKPSFRQRQQSFSKQPANTAMYSVCIIKIVTCC